MFFFYFTEEIEINPFTKPYALSYFLASYKFVFSDLSTLSMLW